MKSTSPTCGSSLLGLKAAVIPLRHVLVGPTVRWACQVRKRSCKRTAVRLALRVVGTPASRRAGYEAEAWCGGAPVSKLYVHVERRCRTGRTDAAQGQE